MPVSMWHACSDAKRVHLVLMFYDRNRFGCCLLLLRLRGCRRGRMMMLAEPALPASPVVKVLWTRGLLL